MLDIPTFPNFRPIKLSDNEWYMQYYVHQQPYASYYFGNLFAWFGLYDNLSLSLLNNNIVFQYTDVFNTTKKTVSFSLLGENQPAETLQAFFSTYNSADTSLTLVPEGFVQQLGATNHTVQEDVDRAEYILDAPSFATLSGPSYLPTRLAFGKFEREYKEKISLREYDTADTSSQQYLLDFYKHWVSDAKPGNTPQELETIAIQKRFGLSKVLKPNCMAIHIGGKIEGFLFYSYPPQHQYAIVHHIKCNYSLYDYTLHLAAQKFAAEGKKYINIEQDMGDETLRAHKQALKPIKTYKMYTIN